MPNVINEKKRKNYLRIRISCLPSFNWC